VPWELAEALICEKFHCWPWELREMPTNEVLRMWIMLGKYHEWLAKRK